MFADVYRFAISVFFYVALAFVVAAHFDPSLFDAAHHLATILMTFQLVITACLVVTWMGYRALEPSAGVIVGALRRRLEKRGRMGKAFAIIHPLAMTLAMGANGWCLIASAYGLLVLMGRLIAHYLARRK